MPRFIPLARLLAIALFCSWLAGSHQAAAQEDPETPRAPLTRPPIEAGYLNGDTIGLDGKLTEGAWSRARFAEGFYQARPDEGLQSTVDTQVAFMYDESALYVGARMELEGEVQAQVARRDQAGNSERIIVTLDSYNDKRTAYSFAVTASGVRVDYYHPSDSEGHRDYSWDPVWDAAADVQPGVWTAEMRIPFSQLRFNRQESQEWGINMNRWSPRINEDSYWIQVPREETGWSSRFGSLVGIDQISPSSRIELLPYVASDARVLDQVNGADPFSEETAFNGAFGTDVKMGLGPNLTLDGTVNPDFGQVEADPAVVNLSAFETFFSERRPFFTEGSQLLSGNGPGYFYSRRIGAPPSGPTSGDFEDRPSTSSILGAAKVTGRLNSGMSIGVLGAVTAREYADTYNETTSAFGKDEVAPLSGYGVLRMQKEFGEDASTVGLSLTGVRRDISDDEPLGEMLTRQAYSGGIDFNRRFNKGQYELSGHAGFSHINGSAAAIERRQTSSARYFQRPDADYVEPNGENSMTGYATAVRLRKRGGKNWLWGFGGGLESPEFEINDAGRLSTADDIDVWGEIEYRETKPGKVFRDYQIELTIPAGWNFGGNRQYTFFDLEASATWKNFAGTFVNFERWTRAQSDNLTRGGPSMGTGAGWNAGFWAWSNGAAKTQVEGGFFYGENELGSWDYDVETFVTFRPGSRWQLSINPEWSRVVSSRQFVTSLDGGRPETFDRRYVFSFVDRKTLSTTFRLNYSFTPDLSLELYAEPFAASGHFYDFGELSAARSRDLRQYGVAEGTTAVRNEDGTTTVTDGADSFEISNRDFNFLSFRSNLVLRWEWRRGSTLFLVWQQDKSDFERLSQRVGPGEFFDSFSASGDNFFALKASYWFPVN